MGLTKEKMIELDKLAIEAIDRNAKISDTLFFLIEKIEDRTELAYTVRMATIFLIRLTTPYL